MLAHTQLFASLYHLNTLPLACADLCYADDFTGDGKSTYYYAAVEGAGYIKPRLQVLLQLTLISRC